MAVAWRVPARSGGRRPPGPVAAGVAAPPAAAPSLASDDGVRAAYRQLGPALFHHAVLCLRDRGLAEEAVQETFVRAWRNADRFDPGVGSLRTWLFAILRNVVIDLARARAIRPALATEPDRLDRDAAADDETDGVLTASVLADALARISDEHRGAIVETHLRGRSYADVAADLGVPVGTVRSRVFYGLRALRGVLEAGGLTR